MTTRALSTRLADAYICARQAADDSCRTWQESDEIRGYEYRGLGDHSTTTTMERWTWPSEVQVDLDEWATEIGGAACACPIDPYDRAVGPAIFFSA